MRRYLSHFTVLVLIAAAGFAAGAAADVYRWTDENGTVHFGDKPQDKALADKAEQVEVVESYQPTVRTAEEREAYEREQEAIKRRREVYRQEDDEAHNRAEKQARAEKADLCANLAENIKKLSSTETVDGVRTRYYIGDENGKSVTSERQREIVEELRQKYAEAGCK